MSYRKWYVYEVLDENDQCIYVGKGTKGRMFTSLSVQEGVSVRAVAYFNCELACLAFERDLIRERTPPKNKAVKKAPATAREWCNEAKHDPREWARRWLKYIDYCIDHNVQPKSEHRYAWECLKRAQLAKRAAV